jgi:rare lipoprotein A
MMRRAAAVLLCALLAACASGPKEPGRTVSSLPMPATRGANHANIDPDLPALPAAGSGRGGYYQDDGPGENPPARLLETPDAQVKAEPYNKYANRPYVVFGKTYTPILDASPFEQRGQGSWYGKKFHGQRTSSGEIYDMYKMTAAHPTLPIPSYARVTSYDSGKSVVVRINDRGPFHASRVIDLSYTAALKLGLLDKGSHEVKVERLLPDDPERLGTTLRNAPQAPLAPADAGITALMLEDRDPDAAGEPAPVAKAETAPGYYLQLGAWNKIEMAQRMRESLKQYGPLEGLLEVVTAGAVHRLFGGPFASRADAFEAASELPNALRLKPIVVKRP